MHQLADAFTNKPRLTLFALSVVLLAPSLVLGVGESADLEVHYVWARAFPAAIADGQIYPRWLDDAFYGMGSPAFYFYPPLVYYGCALATMLTAGAASTTHVIAIVSLLALFASGLAMHAWLSRLTPSPLLRIAGAAAFVAAPYHVLMDHYYRGALAEFAAVGLLPAIALALQDLRAGARWGGPKLIAAYAALIYCHMPTALLVSLLFIPAYVVFLAFNNTTAPERWRFVVKAGAAGLIALALASPYLLPALTLQDQISARAWSVDPSAYLPLRPHLWPRDRLFFSSGFASMAGAWFVLAAGLAWLIWRKARGWSGDLFWPALAAVYAGLVMGVVPGFWSLPLIERVQFPLRLMPVVEFAAITAAALAIGQISAPAWKRLAIATLVVGVWGVGVFGVFAVRSVWRTFTTIPAWSQVQDERMFDAPEYLPKDFYAVGDDWYERQLAEARAAPEAQVVEGDGAVSVIERRRSSVLVESGAAGRIAVRRFYFPSWVAVREGDGAVLPTEPFGASRFVSFEAAPGERYLVRRTTLGTERTAWMIAALAALASLLWCAIAAIRARRPLGEASA